MEFAGFFRRFFAWLIDHLAMFVLVLLLMLALGALLAQIGNIESDILAVLAGLLACVVFGMLFVFQFIYFGYFWSKSGQTVGMKLLDVKVVRQGDEAPLSFWRAAFRGTIGYYVSGLIFSLGFIWAAFDGQKEAWHDKLFDTWVVRSE